MRVFISGSADGLGQMAAAALVEGGHDVVLHARSAARCREALAKVPGAESAFSADLSSIAETVDLARRVNASGRFDAVIHNAAVGYREARRIETGDGLPHLFAINTLSVYLLSVLMLRPARLIYLSSGLHQGGDASLDDLAWRKRPWQGTQAYSDSKLHDAILACAFARHWPEVRANALEPGWVATKMGGRGASDDLSLGASTQVWLATSDDAQAAVSGRYFYHLQQRPAHRCCSDIQIQDRLLQACAELSGVTMEEQA